MIILTIQWLIFLRANIQEEVHQSNKDVVYYESFIALFLNRIQI